MRATSVVTVSTTSRGREVVVRLRGEIDIANVADLRSTLEQALAEPGADIVIDCAKLRFIDAVGLGVLAWLAAQTAQQGRLAAIRNASAFQQRLLDLTYLDRCLRIELDLPSPDHRVPACIDPPASNALSAVLLPAR